MKRGKMRTKVRQMKKQGLRYSTIGKRIQRAKKRR